MSRPSKAAVAMVRAGLAAVIEGVSVARADGALSVCELRAIGLMLEPLADMADELDERASGTELAPAELEP